MTLTEAMNQVRRYANATEFTAVDGLVKAFLSEAIRSVATQMAFGLCGRAVSWFAFTYPANTQSYDLTQLPGFPTGGAIIVHVGLASDDTLTTLETYAPADERDLAGIYSKDFRGDTYSTVRWKHAAGNLYLYPPPTTATALRVGIARILATLPQNASDEIFADYGSAIKDHAARAAVLAAARDLVVVRGGEFQAMQALYQEAIQQLLDVGRGQIAANEPVPSVVWKDTP